MELRVVLALRGGRVALLFLAVRVAALAQHDRLRDAMMLLRLGGAVGVLATLVHATVWLYLGARFIDPTYLRLRSFRGHL